MKNKILRPWKRWENWMLLICDLCLAAALIGVADLFARNIVTGVPLTLMIAGFLLGIILLFRLPTFVHEIITIGTPVVVAGAIATFFIDCIPTMADYINGIVFFGDATQIKKIIVVGIMIALSWIGYLVNSYLKSKN